MRTYHELKCAVNDGCRVAGWLRSGNVQLKLGGELHCAPHHRPPFPMPGHGHASSQCRRERRTISPRPRQTTRDARPGIGMPSREVFRTIQHATGVNQAFVGSQNGYLCVVVL